MINFWRVVPQALITDPQVLTSLQIDDDSKIEVNRGVGNLNIQIMII